MARQTPDGLIKVHWLTTIEDTSAPTEGELAAGVELTSFLAPAGILLPDEGTEADASDLSSARDKSVPSTVGGNPEAEFYRDDSADTAWTTLPRNTAGYLVVAPFGGTTAVTGALKEDDIAEVWDLRVSNRNPLRYARGDTQRFAVTFVVEADPVFAATIAG